MQHVILAIALFISATLFSQSQNNLEKAEGKTITITIENVLSDKGDVKFGLYTRENFSKESMDTKTANIKNGKSTVSFENVPAGVYAVVCYHDENKNERMDFYENGMPKESFGSSDNTWSFGPPQFENSKFEVADHDLTLEIKF